MTYQMKLDLPEEKPQELKPGTLVVCEYRMPSTLQPWIHEIYVGTVEAPGTDPAQWNGQNSEEHYCQVCKKTRVCYSWSVMHDSTEYLIPITPEQAALSSRDKVAFFLGSEALRNLDRSHGVKTNIYSPYHIIDEGSLRYSVVTETTERVAIHLCWTDAVFVAESLNLNKTSPYIEKLLKEKQNNDTLIDTSGPLH